MPDASAVVLPGGAAGASVRILRQRSSTFFFVVCVSPDAENPFKSEILIKNACETSEILFRLFQKKDFKALKFYQAVSLIFKISISVFF